METLSLALGQVIRRHRTLAGFSQEELAARSGLHRTYISFLERGVKSPTVDVLARLGQALGVRGSELLAEAEETLDVPAESVTR